MSTKPGKPFTVCLALLVFLSMRAVALPAQGNRIELPKPQTDGGKPLMQALKTRHSTRSFSAKALSMQTLSNLLWAAFGINRPDSDKRTAPSARNWQEIDIYVATPDGLYVYEPSNHWLTLVLPEDVRSKTGSQAFVGDVPVNFVYVADYAKMGSIGSEQKEFYSAADTGFISQNVYLFCASEGLGTVARASMDRAELAKIMRLRSDQKITLAQSVGYPGK